MFGFFADQALTTPLTRLSMTTLLSPGSPRPVSAVVYFGSTAAEATLAAAAGGNIFVSVASGGDIAPAEVRLAASEAGLAVATGGAALSIGAEISGGALGAVPVWIAVDAAIAGRYGINLQTSSVVENA